MECHLEEYSQSSDVKDKTTKLQDQDHLFFQVQNQDWSGQDKDQDRSGQDKDQDRSGQDKDQDYFFKTKTKTAFLKTIKLLTQDYWRSQKF